jgi:hypothetical protein
MHTRAFLKVTSALTVSAMLALPVHAKKKKKPDQTPSPAADQGPKNNIEFMAQTGSEMNEVVLSPLDKPFAHDVRPSLVRLKDNLLDEAKEKPVASAATYQTATKLVDAWLSALKERESRRASMGLAAPPAMDMEHSKKTTLHDWDDVLTFAREVKDSREFQAKEKKKKQFFSDADKNNWKLRTDVLRPELESLYSKFRELKRESTPAPTGAAAQ